MYQTVVILDFGGQYKELIARRVREQGVYAVIKPCSVSPDALRAMNPIGLIFTGGPDSVYAPGAPDCAEETLHMGVPVLGICYGMQLIAHKLGGRVSPSEKSEYGVIEAEFDDKSRLLGGLSGAHVLMSHTDRVAQCPDGFTVTAHTQNCPVAAFEDEARGLYGVQMHPEVERTVCGTDILRRFLFDICGAKGDYSMDDYLARAIEETRERVGDKRVLLGLSGGVDSSVCAALIARAIGKRLTCVYVDHGFMRKGETEQVKAAFSNIDLNLVCVDASERFLEKLRGVRSPEIKRKRIGKEFASVFEDEARARGEIEFLAQGTIYPDVVESGANKSAVIKSHHNVGGLPIHLKFEGVIEPLKGLFKDEVRALGRMLGLPEALIKRQPFPGPGLAIRIVGEITREKLNILREADAIARELIAQSGVSADQYFAVLTNAKSVGVMGDSRTYEYTLAVRAVTTSDFMTCEVAHLPYETLLAIAARVTNEVKGINRVVYDITGKPPATIEWE